ncbi:MAG: nucleotide sugar dehydrogenase [Lachnospiraceae bacterium]|nr:nucleotide sugar dehydrogenase [Lachnospiraceae bacterium]
MSNINEMFDMKRKVVCVQGLGFVGAAMSVAIASARDKSDNILYNVIGIDVDNEAGRKKAGLINEGIFPFENSDKKLEEKLKEASTKGNLKATTDKEYFSFADIVVVDINLDVKYGEDQSPYLDLEQFKNAIHTLGSRIKEDTLVLVETTVPPGTCQKIVRPIIKDEFEKRGLTGQPHIAHSYERVMPGKNYLDSIISYWRVYSGIDDESADMCKAFLESVIRTDEYPLTRLKNTTSTETAKVLENSYRATTIAFMEEWGRFAEAVDVDMFEVVDAIRMRPTHSNMRQPGFGVGGYCLTKDPYFAMLASKDLFNREDLEFPFSTMAVRYNNKMPIVSVDYLEQILGGLKEKKILLLGVSYRQDVGDTRYSPSEIFAREVIKRGGILTYQDPLVERWTEMNIDVESDIPQFEGYDAVVFAVQHKEYTEIDFSDIHTDKTVLIFDANRVLTDEQIEKINKNGSFIFKSIGRGMGL